MASPTKYYFIVIRCRPAVDDVRKRMSRYVYIHTVLQYIHGFLFSPQVPFAKNKSNYRITTCTALPPPDVVRSFPIRKSDRNHGR